MIEVPTETMNILLVEDNPADARLVREMLRDAGPSGLVLTHVPRLHEALEHLRDFGFNAVLLDLTLPDSDGLATFTRAHREAPHAPIVVLTGLADEEVAARAVRDGAQDYLVKGRVDAEVLYRSIRYAVARQGADVALRRSEERFRQLVENMKEAFVVVELPHQQVLYLSRMWEEIWQRPIEEACRTPFGWLEGIHPEDAPIVAALTEAVTRGQSSVDVFRVIRPDASVRWVRARLSPVRDTKGQVYRMVGLLEDITEVRRTEDHLAHAQKMEAVGRLAGGVAHDFNNLLTAILGSADLLLEDLGADHASAGLLTDISNAAQSAAGLTRQLLAFSRRQILQVKPINLNDVVERAEALLHRLIGEDVTLVIVPGPQLETVHADPGQIEQVIMNLAVNARDAMPDGGRLTITTANVMLSDSDAHSAVGATPGPHVMLSVGDTGLGMNAEIRSRLFEPFFTTKEVGKGTGLGLATSFGIVKQSRGFMSVDSEPGRGSTFSIYLPVDRSTLAPEIPDAREAVSLDGTETVLVVEDQEAARSAIVEVLRRRGYRVIEARDGEQAVSVAAQHPDPIDVLITDVVMPGINGRRAAALIREHRPGLRVIYMSGYTSDTIAHHGLLDHGLAFLQKPFMLNALLQKVREVIDAESPPAI